MIKDNQRQLNRIHVFLDIIILILSFAIAYFIRFKSPLIQITPFNLSGVGYYKFNKYLKLLLYIVPAYVVVCYATNMYHPKRSMSHKRQMLVIANANFLTLLWAALVLFFLKDKFGHMAGSVILLSFALNTTFEVIFRLSLSKMLEFYRRQGMNMKHILVVGYSCTAERYIDKIVANPQWGYCIHGILDNKMERGTSYKGIKVLGSVENLELILPQNKLDEIIITLSINDYQNLEHIVKMCEKSGVHTKFVPDYHNIIASKPYTEDLDGIPVINIRHVPLTKPLNWFIKRSCDLIGGILALILFSPVMLITALIIKLTSKGPIFYSQVRIGLHNKEFKMYKFRSMQVQSEAKEKKAWTTMNDPRVTPIGKFIRKTSIDELPQLFNVILGNMSLIGPRPERPFFVEKFKEEIPRYMIKHQVRPGMTGWAQINGYRGDTSIQKRIEHDLYYIENWTLGLDIKILFLTVFKGFVNRNAY